MFEGDDLVADGESESGAFADRLGREERIKHAGLDFLGDATAVVVNPDLEVVLSDYCVGCDGDGGMGLGMSMDFEGVDAIAQEIHDDLVKLAGKTDDRRKRAVIFVDANALGV